MTNQMVMSIWSVSTPAVSHVAPVLPVDSMIGRRHSYDLSPVGRFGPSGQLSKFTGWTKLVSPITCIRFSLLKIDYDEGFS